MKFKKHRHDAGNLPPSVDEAFADALAGSSDRRHARNRNHHYKALQLCRQVQRTLALALAGECGDDILRNAFVQDVTPAPDAGHLVVRVAVPPDANVRDLLARLDRVGPRLRAIVAAAITRKRAPELTFIPSAPSDQEVRHD